jgi:hypothetical protein
VISPIAQVDISLRLATAMPIEALVKGTPVLPMTDAPTSAAIGQRDVRR